MAIDATLPNSVTSAVNAATSGNSSGSSSASGTLAANFQTFLTLLTTQLKNQNPLDPLDTNQFTQQLVQFAQVEQQLKGNEQLTSLVAMQKSQAATQALNYVGFTAVVDGSTSALKDSQAVWTLATDKTANATVNILNSTGQTVYTGKFNITSGATNFVWDGKGNDGMQWPDGQYKISVTATDTAGQTTTVATEIQAIVDSVDLTADPPLLSIGGQSYTVDKIKRVVRPTVNAPAA